MNEIDRGVEYYNIKITKREHKDNKYEMAPLSLLSEDSVPPVEIASSGEGQTEEGEGSVCAIAHSTPQAPPPTNLITEDNVKRCVTQLFKNEERYKLKLRLNAVINGEDQNIDFIAPLTTDRRNFKRYFPEGCEQWFVEWSDIQYGAVKERFGVKAHRGKFHLAQAYKNNKKTITQVEPWCQCVVWYDKEHNEWNSIIHLYEFSIMQTLGNEGITARQRASNLHRHDLWMNPKYDTRTRPQTWAEKMKGKI